MEENISQERYKQLMKKLVLNMTIQNNNMQFSDYSKDSKKDSWNKTCMYFTK